MERFACNGWLYVTTDERDLATVNIRITHHQCHTPYIDISIPDDVLELIEHLKDLSAAKVNIFGLESNISSVTTPDMGACFAKVPTNRID